ncbi:MAG: tail protein X [Thermoguttaceae bacterium]|nr:tail protein X [Thermoguttaceae bacterium]MDW8039079.1 tail protein X [Thermoguttaceae bacterium]
MDHGARKLLALSILVGGLGLAWLLRPAGQGLGFGLASGRLILRKQAPAPDRLVQDAFRRPLLPSVFPDTQQSARPSGGNSSRDSVASVGRQIPHLAPPVLPPEFPYPQAPTGQPPDSPNATAVRRHSTAVRRHRIADGDSLEKLAERYLGSPALAEQIYQANRALLPDPSLLPIGLEIIIPDPHTLQPIPFSQIRQGKLVPLPDFCAEAEGSRLLSPPGTP